MKRALLLEIAATAENFSSVRDGVDGKRRGDIIAVDTNVLLRLLAGDDRTRELAARS